MFNPAAARARCEAIVGARRARSQLMTDNPKLTLEYLALTDLPAALEALEEAQGRIGAIREAAELAPEVAIATILAILGEDVI